MKTREKDLEAKVIRYAKAKGCLIYKFSSPSHRGVCDRIIVIPGGMVWFLELKRQGEKPTPLQKKFLADIQKQGGFSGWTDDFNFFKSALDIYIETFSPIKGIELLS